MFLSLEITFPGPRSWDIDRFYRLAISSLKCFNNALKLFQLFFYFRHNRCSLHALKLFCHIQSVRLTIDWVPEWNDGSIFHILSYLQILLTIISSMLFFVNRFKIIQTYSLYFIDVFFRKDLICTATVSVLHFTK